MRCDGDHIATNCFRRMNIVTVCLVVVTLNYQIVMDYFLQSFKNGSY